MQLDLMLTGEQHLQHQVYRYATTSAAANRHKPDGCKL